MENGTIAGKSVGDRLNPYVFLVGSARSGTTLLKRMVNMHPQLAITRETHWITRFYKGRGVSREGLVTPELLPQLFAYHRFPHLNIDRAEIEKLVLSDRPISYADFVSDIFDLYAQGQGKRLAGDKTPAYVRNISKLHALWPKARFVHLIRDGRDVCLSMMKWRMVDRTAKKYATWNEDPLTTTALWWEREIMLGIEDGRALGKDLYCEMSYETLVANPAGECASLCRFLDLPFDDAMLRYHEGKTKNEPGLSANRAWLPPTPGLRDWRSQMDAEDVERFEAVTGHLLDKLGYTRSCPRPGIKAKEHAQRIRASFTADANARGLKMPKSW